MSYEWVEVMERGWAGPSKGRWADRCYREARVGATGESRCRKVCKWVLQVGISVRGHYKVQVGAMEHKIFLPPGFLRKKSSRSDLNFCQCYH